MMYIWILFSSNGLLDATPEVIGAAKRHAEIKQMALLARPHPGKELCLSRTGKCISVAFQADLSHISPLTDKQVKCVMETQTERCPFLLLQDTINHLICVPTFAIFWQNALVIGFSTWDQWLTILWSLLDGQLSYSFSRWFWRHCLQNQDHAVIPCCHSFYTWQSLHVSHQLATACCAKKQASLTRQKNLQRSCFTSAGRRFDDPQVAE